MLLKDYLHREKIPTYKFAKSAGIAPAAIYRALSGSRRLSSRSAIKIESATNGMVSRTEAMWPEDYIDIDTDGSEQYRLDARIH